MKNCFNVYVNTLNSLFVDSLKHNTCFLFSEKIPQLYFYIDKDKPKVLQSSNLVTATLSSYSDTFVFISNKLIFSRNLQYISNNPLILTSFNKITFNKFLLLTPISSLHYPFSITNWDNPFTKNIEVSDIPFSKPPIQNISNAEKYLTLLFAKYFVACYSQTYYNPFQTPSSFSTDIINESKKDPSFIIRCCHTGFSLFCEKQHPFFSCFTKKISLSCANDLHIQGV